MDKKVDRSRRIRIETRPSVDFTALDLYKSNDAVAIAMRACTTHAVSGLDLSIGSDDHTYIRWMLHINLYLHSYLKPTA